MNVKAVKKPERRVEVNSLSNLGIQSYGYNNLYPQELRGIVACSESASTCMDRYVSFIEGNGFKDVAFSELIVNSAGETCDDILHQVAEDVGNDRGFALHINYNVMCEPVELSFVPFENCRLCEPDDSGYIGKIAVHPDWTGKTKRNGKLLKVSKDTIDYIDVYNPDKNVIAAQIEAAGSIENYKGQILWVSGSRGFAYPKPVHDSVISQMSTEEGLGNISNRNVRNNFLPAGMLVTKKGQDVPRTNEDGSPMTEDTSISDAVGALQGDDKANKVLQVEIENNEEAPVFTPFQGANYDKDFQVTTTTASQKIYGAFNQEIWCRIMNGSIGFSSEILRDAYEYYSTVTNKERRIIERAFEKVFSNWPTKMIYSGDYSIQPLNLVSSKTNTTELVSLYEKNMITLNTALNSLGLPEKQDGNKYLSDIESVPMAVKLGVGGTQALQSILQDKGIPAGSKVGTFEVLFSISAEESKKMIYGTPDNSI